MKRTGQEGMQSIVKTMLATAAVAALAVSAEANELVDVILFMCSDNASFVTGTNHVIDGGRLCMYQPYVAP